MNMADPGGSFFNSGPFMPHGGCYLWTTSLIALHAISDGLIVLAYYSIPFTLLYFVRRRKDLKFHWMFVCFAVFILACGTTHLMEIWNIWHANYWLSGLIKAITAAASVPTAFLLMKLIPQALALPSPSALQKAYDEQELRVQERTAEISETSRRLELEIEERKRAEAALLDSHEKVKSALRAKDDFLAALSHELRTPLTPVLITISALENDGRLPVDLRGLFAMMSRNLSLEVQLIDDLLDVTRIRHGKLKLLPVLSDLHVLLNHTQEILRPASLDQQVELDFNLDARWHHAEVDPTRIQQVFWNLVRNAVKFTPPGGKIIVSTRNDENGQIIISVKDSGIGIRKDLLPRIFQAFEQGDVAGQTRFGGLGLGLAISKAVAELHGGSIMAVSDGPGLGATFEVTLPTAATEVTLANETTNPPKVRPLKLLLVEDHESTRTVLSQLLVRDGHSVTTVGTVQEALTAVQANDFEVVVCDLGLPDGTGLDLIRSIQSQRPIPAVALSGYGMEEDLQKCQEAGFRSHLLKPVKIDQLRQILNQICPS